MDWAVAIERNRSSLASILAGLLVLAGYAEGSIAARLDGPIYRSVLRALRPMESALRRLIVIAARGLKVELPPDRPKPCPKPEGHVSAGKPAKKGGGRVPSFRLFDTRKRFDLKPRRKPVARGSGPRIWSVDTTPSPLVPAFLRQPPLFQPVPVPGPAPVPDGTVGALRLGRRLVAVKMALEDIPRQALRMARSIARRERIKLARPATITSPLRIGRPPGLRKKPKDEVERVLRECHDLAFDALKQDTS